MDGIKRLRATLQELKSDYPYLSGLSFFGSRTKGTEHSKSDYDV
jgi:predicted nucleotidyltransferase